MNRLLYQRFSPSSLLLFVFNLFSVSFAATVVTKARDVIEPVVMTQIVTKAKEMGKFRA